MNLSEFEETITLATNELDFPILTQGDLIVSGVTHRTEVQLRNQSL
jgi:hypothetical protein